MSVRLNYEKILILGDNVVAFVVDDFTNHIGNIIADAKQLISVLNNTPRTTGDNDDHHCNGLHEQLDLKD